MTAVLHCYATNFMMPLKNLNNLADFFVNDKSNVLCCEILQGKWKKKKKNASKKLLSYKAHLLSPPKKPFNIHGTNFIITFQDSDITCPPSISPAHPNWNPKNYHRKNSNHFHIIYSTTFDEQNCHWREICKQSDPHIYIFLIQRN